jgi:hypothetical protein
VFKTFQTEVTEIRIGAYERSRICDEDFKVKKLKYLIANHFMEVSAMKLS